MERSIVMFGNASWCVTLPKNWITKYGLRKGDKISVVEYGDSLIIKANSQIKLQECYLNLRGINPAMIDKIIGGCYKKGYELIILECENQTQYDEIQRIISEKKLDLYEKTEHIFFERQEFPAKITLVVPGTVSESKLSEQIIALMKEIYCLNDDFVQLWQKKEWEKIAGLVQRDKRINDLADICRRIININPKDGTSTSLYVFVDSLENIGDSYKRVFKTVSAQKLAIDKRKVAAFRSISDLLIMFFNLFKKFEIAKVQEIIDSGPDWKTIDLDNPILTREYFAITKKLMDCLSTLLVANI